jgi:hypothetical protein
MRRDKVVASLAEGSLVMLETLEDGSPSVSIHRLVQEVARGRLVERGAADEAVAQAVGLIADASPHDHEGSNRPAHARLLPHALA